MHLLPILLSLLFPTILATSLILLLPESPNLTDLLLAPLTLAPSPPNTNTSNSLTSQIGCFKQTKVPPFLPTNKSSCEAALDIWVHGQSLMRLRSFSRNPSTLDYVLLPMQRETGSCMIYASMLNEDDEDELTLAEVYAELMGPDGVMKQCLGQVLPPAIGGRMVLGRKGLLRVVVTGRQVGGVEG